jgi:hypothetical protein
MMHLRVYHRIQVFFLGEFLFFLNLKNMTSAHAMGFCEEKANLAHQISKENVFKSPKF